jgi:hypothetical protein
MDNILLRSPFYINKKDATAETATLSLTLNGTQRYTLTKNTNSTGDVLFEISELSRDYLEVYFYGSYLPVTIDISTTVTFYDANGVSVSSSIDNFVGFDGYGEFKEGKNPKILPGALLQSNTTVYIPENKSGFIPTESSNDVLYNQFTGVQSGNVTFGSHTITIKRICEPKYSPIKITFVNKFGVLQDIWFFKKTVESLNTTKSTFKRNILTSSGSYNTFTHSKRTLNVVGNEVFTSNTGFIDERMNDVFKELMLSEQVWATIESIVHPIVVTSNQLQYKTSLNNKLINFTIDFEYAYDTINNIR